MTAKPNNSNLLKTGDYCDFVIICGQARHKVHKAIICPRSDFFKAACGSGFKEAQTGEIELPDDDPFAVSMMIQYLYHQTYTIPHDLSLVREDQGFPTATSKPSAALLRSTRHSFSGDSSAIHSLLHPPQAAPAPSLLHKNHHLYALGEKYGINGLKALAVYKFETEGEDEFRSSVNYFEDFIQVMKEAYACTAEGDRPLRDAIVRILKPKTILFEREDMKDFLKEESLAYDLVMSYVQDNSRKGKEADIFYRY
ncbi:BTB/POZ domain [Fusarium oxysporum f. sp. vasinfectum]|nr:BTB/POZ domain [Fusarium oxysporum f. sp. vasinfectum]